MELKIVTFNVRGLNMTNKIFILKDLLENNNIDICMLQETHLDNVKSVQNIKEITCDA